MMMEKSGDNKKRGVPGNCVNTVMCSGDIIEYVIAAPVDEKEAVRLDAEGSKCLKNGASYVLIDLKKSTQFDSVARRQWVKFLRNPKIKKAAIFGGSIFVRTLASFVISAAKGGNVRFFATREDAMEWIQS